MRKRTHFIYMTRPSSSAASGIFLWGRLCSCAPKESQKELHFLRKRQSILSRREIFRKMHFKIILWSILDSFRSTSCQSMIYFRSISSPFHVHFFVSIPFQFALFWNPRKNYIHFFKKTSINLVRAEGNFVPERVSFSLSKFSWNFPISVKRKSWNVSCCLLSNHLLLSCNTKNFTYWIA